ncbi:MAG: hypothetical protein J5985_02800 [Kiritimatiellae bacterium]|nr:hypothetical protein [Kiritimatiellia bacterium]
MVRQSKLPKRRGVLLRKQVMFCAAFVAGMCEAAVNPCDLEFKLIASRRYMLDNELVISELVPGAVVRPGVQHPFMPYCTSAPTAKYGNGAVAFSAPADAPAEGTVFVGAFYPGVHFSQDVGRLSPGAAALMDIASRDGSMRLRVRAEPGKPVAFSETRAGLALDARLFNAKPVPKPPFRLSAVVAGPTVLLAMRKDGDVRFLGAATLDESPENDIRRRDFAGTLKCAAGFALPPGGTGVMERASVSLTVGVGQADFRIVTDGPGCRPYFENGRIFCTFSARAGHKYTKSVASIDPATFDFRMEGILLTSYGDDDPLLRNDAVNHLFRDSDGTWKAVGCGWSTANNKLGERKGNGLLVMESVKNPLHGITVMKARLLKVGTGISEDPYFTYDAATNKWRLATSSFVKGKGLRAHLWESDRWDGPYVKIAGPGAYDSTGCQIMDFGGRKFVMTANVKRMRPVYEYPSLAYVGEWKCDFEPYDAECSNGRIFTAFAEMPEGYPYRYVMVTMDRQNIPEMPKPNWTYGGMYFYGANP